MKENDVKTDSVMCYIVENSFKLCYLTNLWKDMKYDKGINELLYVE